MAERKTPKPSQRKQAAPKEPKQVVKTYRPERRTKPKHGVDVYARTNAYALVGVILLIALIATIIVAPQHRFNQEKFTFFSPSQFLSNLSSTTLVLPPGEYLCGSEGSLEGSPLFGTIRATIEGPDGRVYRSDNFIPWLGVLFPDERFVFTIDGVQYFTEWRSVFNYPEDIVDERWLSRGVVPVLVLTQALPIEIMAFPDFGVVADAWEDVTILDWPKALAATGKFFRDMLSYQTNLLTAVLPWNTVSSSEEVTDMQIPWRDAQNNYIDP